MKPGSKITPQDDPVTASQTTAFAQSLPVLFGYLPLGTAFGVLATDAGLHWTAVVSMSLLIYAGAGQFMAVALLASGAGLIELSVATLMVNSRHLFYGLSLLTPFSKAGWRKPYLIFALTDETYSILAGHSAQRSLDPTMAFRISLFNHGWWISGTLIGVLLGTANLFDSQGIEFTLVALFIVLTLEQARQIKQAFPFVMALAGTGGAFLLVPDQHLLLASITGACLLLLLRYRLTPPPSHAIHEVHR